MFALTFFGVLHVPINVPALGISTGEDNLNVDRELMAHGVTNALSGFAGSIQVGFLDNVLITTDSSSPELSRVYEQPSLHRQWRYISTGWSDASWRNSRDPGDRPGHHRIHSCYGRRCPHLFAGHRTDAGGIGGHLGKAFEAGIFDGTSLLLLM